MEETLVAHVEAEAADQGPSTSLEVSQEGQPELDYSAAPPSLKANVSPFRSNEEEPSAPDSVSDVEKGASIPAVETTQVGHSNGSGSVSGRDAPSVASSCVTESAPLSHIPRHDAARLGACHAFSNLFIVDLAPVKDHCATELVEFSWIAFDVEQRTSSEETSVIVRPQRVPVSQETLAKLGISDEQFASASTLADAIGKFDAALFRKFQETRRPTMICSFGRQKLSRDLRAAAQANEEMIDTPQRFLIRLGVRSDIFTSEISKKFKMEELSNLRTAASALQLSLPEEHDEGLPACRCMADMLVLLLSKGFVLKKEHAVTVDEAEADATATGLGGVGTHIRLRGLPWDVTPDAVVQFLKPIASVDEADVCICLGLDKRVTGEAFVSLPTASSRDLAVKTLHGRMMGQRWIEVFKANPEDFERAVQRRVAVLSSTSNGSRDADVRGLNLTVLKLRGLPWSCTEREIVHFFKEYGFDIRLDDVALGITPDGRLSGIAYVEMVDSETAEAAKEKLHRKYLGKRFVEVYPSTKEEMSRTRRPCRTSEMVGSMRSRGRYGGISSTGPYGGAYGGTVPLGHVVGHNVSAGAVGNSAYGTYGSTGDIYSGYGTQAPCGPSNSSTQELPAPSANWNSSVLRLRGMPFNANEHHIVQFFQGLHMVAILPSTVPIDGRPSGEAYVEFVDTNEAWRAFQTRNGAHMDRRYIELFPASKQEMNYAAQGGDPRVFRERERVL